MDGLPRISAPASQTRKMKYWRGVTVMTGAREGAQDVRMQLEKKKHEQQTRLDMRWPGLEYLYKLIKQATMQRRPGLDDYFALYNELGYVAESSSDGCSVAREDFVSIVLRLYIGSKRKQANKLYSAFDIEHLDQVDFRRIMSCQRCLWHVNETALEKLNVIWALYTQGGDADASGTLHKNLVEDILTTCAVTERETTKMKTLFERTFRERWKIATFESARNHLNFQEFTDGIHADNRDYSRV